jgi:predicted CoA-binding protein
VSTLEEAAQNFLSSKRIAVAGASRSGDTAGNAVYRKLRSSGYEVFAVNPNAEQIEGDACYADVGSIPGGVEGVVVATHPNASADVVRDCIDAGIKHVWFHRAFGAGSVSDEAVELAESAGLELIPGGCPMMHCEPVDVGHKCIKWILGTFGKLPR